MDFSGKLNQLHKKTCGQNLAWKLKHCTSAPRNSQRLSWIWILKLRYTEMSACANTQTHTQNFKTESSTRANSAIFLLAILTWAQFHLKLVGFFFLSQGCRIKPAGSRQTTTEVFRSLVLQGRRPDHCRGQGGFCFFFVFSQLSEDITLAFLWNVSYQKLKKRKPRWSRFLIQGDRPDQCLMILFFFKDGNRITNLLHLICTFLWKGKAPKEIFLKCLFSWE